MTISDPNEILKPELHYQQNMRVNLLLNQQKEFDKRHPLPLEEKARLQNILDADTQNKAFEGNEHQSEDLTSPNVK